MSRSSYTIQSPAALEGLSADEYRRIRATRRRRLSLSRSVSAGLPTRVNSKAMVI